MTAQLASILGAWEPSFYVVQCYFRFLDEGKSIWQRQGLEKGALELRAGILVYATIGDRWLWEHGNILAFILHLEIAWSAGSHQAFILIGLSAIQNIFLDIQSSPVLACSHGQLHEIHVKSKKNDLQRLLTLQVHVSLSKAPSSHARTTGLQGWNKNPSSWLKLFLLYTQTQMLIFLTQR